MRVCLLASGSSGNATLIVAGGSRVLVDCGLSARETIKRIQEVGEDPARLDAVVVTHEHSDHMRGLVALSKALNTRVYISDAALEACNLRSEEHTSELQSLRHLVCRLLLEKKKKHK